MKNITKNLLIFSILTSLFCASFASMSVNALDPFKSACDKLSAGQRAQSEACNQNSVENPVGGPNGVLMSITNQIALISGIVAVIIVIIGGFQYITSGGDANKATNARRAIIYSLVGIIIIVIAQSIVAYVITKVV